MKINPINSVNRFFSLMAKHSLEEYKKLMPYVVGACEGMGLMKSDPALFEGVASWLFMARMVDELSDEELSKVHEMFWDAFNARCGGRVPDDIIRKSMEAVNSWGNINITIGGDIFDYALEGFEG